MHKKLEIAISKIAVEYPFLKIYPYSWDIQESSDIPTMATNYTKLLYNANFLDILSVEQIVAVLIHEIFHCVMLHPTQVDRGISANRDYLVWDISLEQVVNQEVLEVTKHTKYTLPGEPADPEDILLGKANGKRFVYGRRFHNMDSVAIYEALIKHKKHKPQCDLVLVGDVIAEKGNSEITQSAVEKAIATMEQIRKARGTLSAGLERLLKQLTNSKVPFERILRSFVNQIVSGYDDFSFSKPNTRHPLSDEIFIPDLVGYEIEAPVVVVDTSGSISEKELEQFASALAKLTDLVSEVTVVTTDAKVNEVVKIRSIRDVLSKVQFKGGGGTDFEDVFNQIKKTPFMVFFTDGIASYPEQPPSYPVLWILTREHVKPPFGKVAYVFDS